MKAFLLFLTTLLTLSVSAQDKKEKESDTSAMKVYYMVFLKSGPTRNHTPEEAKKIQEGHMAHLDSLYANGLISLAGPFMDKDDIRGIVVYNIEGEAEVKRLAEADPAVKAGRLIVEIHPWYSQKGAYLK